MIAVDPTFQMWATFALIIVALGFYMVQRIPLEVTSLLVVATLLVLFNIFPLADADGANLLGPRRLLEGFANPALITVLALLVVGQGLLRTGVLDRAANLVIRLGHGSAWRSVSMTLVVVLVVSAFLNNIPVVVIFIPIMQALAGHLGRPAAKLMMPLSFAAILGGMTTLIGSSTNLLVSSSLIELGLPEFHFFDFTIPGMVLAASGLVYVLLVAPRLIRSRGAPDDDLFSLGGGKQFIAQIIVSEDSKMVGQSSVGGFFPNLKEMTVRLVQRGEHAYLPPFDALTIRPRDVIVVAATRDALIEAIKADPGLLDPMIGEAREETERGARAQVLAEVMISPASRLIGRNLEQFGFRRRFNAIVLGIQRRTRMIRAAMSEIRLEAGDVLMVQGEPGDIRALRGHPDLILLEWSATDLPSPFHARRATAAFLGTVLLAATGILPIVIAAVLGAAAMIVTGCLTARQAARAIDRTVFMMMGAALALGVALEATGGASYLADTLLWALAGAGPTVVLSGFFLMVALLTNVLNTKASAVLFTPIAVEIARGLGVDPIPFAVAVVFAANCSFASPIGYQTNLLVMAPGNYRFVDFVIVGLPMIIVVWIAFTLFAPWYFGL